VKAVKPTPFFADIDDHLVLNAIDKYAEKPNLISTDIYFLMFMTHFCQYTGIKTAVMTRPNILRTRYRSHGVSGSDARVFGTRSE